MWIYNIFHLVGGICSGRITGRPMVHGRAIKIVVNGVPWPTQGEEWSIALGRLVCKKKGWNQRVIHQRLTRIIRHLFNHRTVDVPFLPINQAAISQMTHQLVVYVALDEDLSAELFPEWEAHGVVVCFIQRRSCGDRTIHSRTPRPNWPQSDRIRFMVKMTVIVVIVKE